MRTIKFRGKRIDNGEYVYGGEFRIGVISGKPIIDFYDNRQRRVGSEVVPDSVALFTEFVDKDGAEVYEGDTLELDYDGAAKVIGEGSLIRDLEDSKPTADAKLKVEFSHGRYQLRWRTKNGCVDTGVDLYLLESVKQFVRRCD